MPETRNWQKWHLISIACTKQFFNFVIHTFFSSESFVLFRFQKILVIKCLFWCKTVGESCVTNLILELRITLGIFHKWHNLQKMRSSQPFHFATVFQNNLIYRLMLELFEQDSRLGDRTLPYHKLLKKLREKIKGLILLSFTLFENRKHAEICVLKFRNYLYNFTLNISSYTY